MSSEGGLAILGAGIFAKEAHLPALAKLGSSAPTVKAIYSRSEKSAADLASAAQFTLRLSSAPDVYFDDSPHNTLDALLSRSDISTVLVLLPITLQPSIVLKSLAAGKHVISEKPVAPDVASGRALIEEYEAKYKSKGLVWRVAENWEAEPGYRKIGEMIREGKIGRVVFFKSIVVNYIDRNSKWYKTPWRTVPDYQGGFLLDGGVHTIAALRTLLPGPPTHLTGFSSLTKSYLMPHDTIHSVLKREPSNSTSTPSTDADGNTITDGYHGIQEITFAHPTPSKPTIDAYVITGTKGYVTVRNVDGGIQAVFTWLVKETDEDGNEVEKEQPETHTFPVAGIEVELKSFFDEVKGQGDGVGLGDPWNALLDVAVIQAALNSGGELVDLRELVKSG